jgi:hypothetical protein
MASIIQCRGTIEGNGLQYMDPLINVYYLSYNSVYPIYAFPQIIDNTGSILDQLFWAEIDNGPTIGRADVENAVIMLLQQAYPNCTFTRTFV